MQPLLDQQAIELVTAPATTAISLEEVRQQLRIEHSDDDLLLDRLINVAQAFTDVMGALGHAMINQTWAQWVAPYPSEVRLFLGPVRSVSSIKYYDTDGVLQTATLDNFDVFGTEFATTIKPKSGYAWPSTQNRPDAIRIEYVIGYGSSASDVPEGIRHAMMMLIGHWYENRENAALDQLSDVPYGYDVIIGLYRRAWYG